MVLDYKKLLREEEALLLDNVQKARKQVTEAQDRLSAVTENFNLQQSNLKSIQDKITEFEEFEKFTAAKNVPVEPKKKTVRKETETEAETK